MEQPPGKMSAGEFLKTFWNYFNQTLNLDEIDKQLAGVIQVDLNYNLNLVLR
jgi:hypothetical protein